MKARDWKVEFHRNALFDTGSLDSDTVGSNRCARDNGAVTGHFIHRTDAVSWLGSAYQLNQIGAGTDGPFAGAYYLTSPNFAVDRLELINPTVLAPNGAAYKANLANSPAIASLLEGQVRAHEQAHSTLMAEWLSWNNGVLDPARKVEELASNSSGDLQAAADTSLRGDESEICEATGHSQVWNILSQMNSTVSAWSSPARVYTSPSNSEQVSAFYRLGQEDPCGQ